MTMNDMELKPLLATNPYLIPRYLLELISGELKSNGFSYSEKAPLDKVKAPVVVPRITRRVPSSSKGLGKTFSGFQKSTTEGEILEQYQQNYTLYVDFEIFYPTSMNIEAGAWQIEQAIISQRGPLQLKYPGSDIIWREQTSDRLDVPSRGEVEKVVIRFQVELPVFTVIPRKTISIIDFDIVHGGLYYKDVRFERPDSSETYAISIENRIVNQISAIKLLRNEKYETLVEGIDYYLEQADEQNPKSPVTIKWIVNTGLYPEVGEDFWVTFVAASLLTSSI